MSKGGLLPSRGALGEFGRQKPKELFKLALFYLIDCSFKIILKVDSIPGQ